jgi:AcrR family transcriptional regulator
MMSDKSVSISVRGEPVRQRVLDAAERLLRQGKADFSMRDLAAEAGVSFATPFNRFGSKIAIMHALSARRIASMEARLSSAALIGDAIDRIFFTAEIAASVMLLEPVVNRAVMGSLGAPGSAPGAVMEQSARLWLAALDRGEGLADAQRSRGLAILPAQLAFGFRGILSFWTAGELTDTDLAPAARRMVATLMLGFADRRRRPALIEAVSPIF